jgi:cytochrome c oxidase cbb3-type subunit 3
MPAHLELLGEGKVHLLAAYVWGLSHGATVRHLTSAPGGSTQASAPAASGSVVPVADASPATAASAGTVGPATAEAAPARGH